MVDDEAEVLLDNCWHKHGNISYFTLAQGKVNYLRSSCSQTPTSRSATGASLVGNGFRFQPILYASLFGALKTSAFPLGTPAAGARRTRVAMTAQDSTMESYWDSTFCHGVMSAAVAILMVGIPTGSGRVRQDISQCGEKRMTR